MNNQQQYTPIPAKSILDTASADINGVMARLRSELSVIDQERFNSGNVIRDLQTKLDGANKRIGELEKAVADANATTKESTIDCNQVG